MKTCFLELTMGHFENKSDLKDGDNWSPPLHLGKTFFFFCTQLTDGNIPGKSKDATALVFILTFQVGRVKQLSS